MTAALRPATAAHPPAPPPRLSIRPAPPREPPFDDELTPDRTSLATRHDQRLPFEPVRPRPRRTPPPLRLGRLPDPAAWSRRLLIALTEAAAGRRPLQQLAPLLSPRVHHGLGADLARIGQPHWLHRARVLTVHATEPAPGVAEVAATVAAGPRVRAVALRLEEHRGRWRCTQLQLG